MKTSRSLVQARTITNLRLGLNPARLSENTPARRGASRLPSTRRVLVGAAIGLAMAMAIGTAPAQDDADIEWNQVYANKAELSPGQGADLDYGDRTASEIDVDFEDWEGGYFWAPRKGARAAIAGPGEFATFDLMRIDGLSPGRDRILLVSGGELKVDPGTILVAVTNENRYVKVSIDGYEGGKLKFQWVTYDKKVIPKAPVGVVSALEAPVLKSPCPEVDFYHEPRNLLLTWAPVRGAVSYVVEIDCKGCCGPRYDWYCAEQEGGSVLFTQKDVPTSAYFVPWTGGAKAGRWRVRGIDKDGKPGPWSGYFTFVFKR